MENKHVPKWVKERLAKEERVVSRISSGMADYYATDKRLLKFRSRSEYDVVEYNKMRITFRKYGLGWDIFRILAVLFGLLAISLGILSFVGPTFVTGTTITHTKAPLGVSFLFVVIGLFVITVALHGHYAYYQIESPDFDNEHLKKWRIQRSRWGSAKLDRFARIVKERSDGSTT